jgi:hypothetical protein
MEEGASFPEALWPETFRRACLDARRHETPASGLNHVTVPNKIASEPLVAVNAGLSRLDHPSCGGRRLLMFSGGRDSTLAAMRMARDGLPMTLVTVSSSHLVGIERVKARLSELAGRLDGSTPWLRVRQPAELRTDTSFYEQTCLPCHHAYVVVSGVLARSLGADRLAFGYAGYQRDWPEQTPYAIACLAAVLERHGIALELPVYEVISKEAATAELSALGLSTEALEQKCLRQITNVALADAQLRRQVELWESAIDRSLGRLDEIGLDILERGTVGDFR